MAHDSHIHHENYEFTGIGGPALVSTFGLVLDLSSRDLDPVVYGGHTLGIALSGSIPEFTYIGGPVPSLVTSHGQVLHLGGRKPTARDELT